jgi:spore coat polysaccharide biosynthesis predicted glycosyltransferase SpsG
VPSLSEIVLEKFPEISMTVISSRSDLSRSSRLQIQKPTGNIDSLFESADLVICSASTSILEVLARRMPSGFILTAENQVSNREYLLSECLSIEIGTLTDGQFVFDLSALGLLLQDINTRKSLQIMCADKFEGLGASLIIDSVEQII